MQDWDRAVMIFVGAGVGIFTAMDGWRLWQQQRFVAVVGIGLLILAAVGAPLALALLS